MTRHDSFVWLILIQVPSNGRSEKNLTTDPEVLGAFSADDQLEGRVGVTFKTPEAFSRESEISHGGKTP